MSEVKGDEFFSDDVNNAMGNASTEDTGGGKKIERPGVYRMVARAKKFAKDDKTFEFPKLKKSENKGSLMCEFMLEVIDGADDVEAGAYCYGNMTLAPAPGASAKKVKDTMCMLKPRLAAFVGKEYVEDFKFDFEWVKEFLTAEFKKDGDEFAVVRDHKMKNEVMVEMVAGVYNNKPKLDIKSIKLAGDGDVSKVTGPNINDNQGFVDESESDLDAIDALANGDAPDGVAEVDVF